MRSLVIISSFLAVSIALKCYNGITTGPPPSGTYICPAGTSQCFKQVSQYNGKPVLGLYGCDIPTNGTRACSQISNGSCQKVGSGTSANTCCCGTDLCNSAGLFQPLLAVGVLVLARFL